MQVVIDIPAKLACEGFERPFTEEEKNVLIKAIGTGTPLPKGHGRLIDADRALTKAWANFYKHEDEWEKKDSDYLLIGRFYDQKGFECCQQTIVNAQTIIEADRSERSDKK